MLFRIYRYIFLYLIYLPFIKKSTGKFTVISPILISLKNLELGKNVFIRNNARIEGVLRYNQIDYSPTISIENNVNIEQNLHLTCANSISIGAETAISANVTITDINHPYENINLPPEKQDIEVGKVKIGRNCKIYNNVVILPDVSLGEHSIIGANSVVTAGEYPPYSILVGSPAKVVKYYCFKENKWIKKC